MNEGTTFAIEIVPSHFREFCDSVIYLVRDEIRGEKKAKIEREREKKKLSAHTFHIMTTDAEFFIYVSKKKLYELALNIIGKFCDVQFLYT